MQIRGSFGIDSGSVSIEDTTLGIVSWSDSLIICNLPDSGKGAGGHVIVQTKNGVSNRRVLSIFSMMIDHLFWNFLTSDFKYHFLFGERWHINWRIDIEERLQQQIPFEISKSSFGTYVDGMGWTNSSVIPWTDSANLQDSSISLSGSIDITHYRIKFNSARMVLASIPHFSWFDTIYNPLPISFDSTGNISNYVDSNRPSEPEIKKLDSLYHAKLLFPPSTKNIVQKSQNYDWDIGLFIDKERQMINLQVGSSLGPTTASLYSIDGRLLKRTMLDISSPGIFSIDVSDMHTHFAILVLQTARGVITKKILF